MFRNASTLFIFSLLILASMAPPNAAADSCQPLADAFGKLATTPTHIYPTVADGPGNKATTTEMIYAGCAVYAKVGGNWTRSNLTTQEMARQDRDKQKNGSCRYLKDESVGGETAAVYSERSHSGEAQAQVWISKSKGLPLREEMDIGSSDKGSNTHMSMRYEYTNVQPPWDPRLAVRR